MTLVRDIRDIVTVHSTGAAPHLNFAEVAPPTRGPQRPPLFLLGPASEIVLHDLAAAIETPRVGCYTLTDATLAPTGIPIKQGVALRGEAFMHPHYLVTQVADRLNAETLPAREVGGDVVPLIGPAHETYGHWLVDFLPRLWVLHQAGYDLAALRFVVPCDMAKFGRTLLKQCGLGEAQLVQYEHWRELLVAERLILPTTLRLGDRLSPCFATATHFWMRRAGHEPPAAPGGGALYLSRAGGQRNLVNRERIEAIAAEHGLAVIRPETMSLSEQIALFASAEVIAGEYGSALHNSIFSGAGAAVCALRGVARHPSLVQSGLATAMDQDVGYVFGGTEGQGADQGFFVMERYFSLALELIRMRKKAPAVIDTRS
jgi:capsular polysaccharide biosynthesis protein